jgi:hypothetical protein
VGIGMGCCGWHQPILAGAGPHNACMLHILSLYWCVFRRELKIYPSLNWYECSPGPRVLLLVGAQCRAENDMPWLVLVQTTLVR